MALLRNVLNDPCVEKMKALSRHAFLSNLFREDCVTLNGRELCGLGNNHAKVIKARIQLSSLISIGSVHAFYTYTYIYI